LDDKTFAAIVRLATGGPAAPAAVGLDVTPKDEVISVDELAEALRPALGPFRVQARRPSGGRTDALFEQLDREKDDALTRPELSASAGSLRPLDRDDDEMIGAGELEATGGPESASSMPEPSGRETPSAAVPSVIEMAEGESSLRLARMLIRRYDRAKEDGR